MKQNEKAHGQIRDFEQHYQYDASYLHELIDDAPAAFEAYLGFQQSMGAFRGAAPDDVRCVARVAAVQSEDCGPCLQLGVRMAVEAGVDKELIRTALQRPEALPPKMRRVYDFARAVAVNAPESAELREQVLADYGRDVVAELAVTIAAARVYPTIKRGFGLAKSCSIVQIDV
jgi:alkylhydroperoxidase family enzyme